jgi:hypothetical protein
MNDLIAIAEDILSRFTQTPDGYRARVGRVQFGKWRDQIDQAVTANTVVPHGEMPADNRHAGTAENCVTCGASSQHWQPQHRMDDWPDRGAAENAL